MLDACERRFTSLIELEKYKMPDGRVDQRRFSRALVSNLPTEIEKFFELQKYERIVSLSESPTGTCISISDIDSPHNGSANT